MLDELINEDVDLCSGQAYDIMYKYLLNVNDDGSYYEEEKYGLKISVGI